MAENLNFNSKNGISLSLASLASLARNLEFSLASRKTSKVQEIAHYTYHSCLTSSTKMLVDPQWSSKMNLPFYNPLDFFVKKF